MEHLRRPSGTAALPRDDFRAAYRKLAVFLGRPASDVVLFSGVPFDEHTPGTEDVERISRRIGLEFSEHDRRDLSRGRIEYPALVLFSDGTALALLEARPNGLIATSLESATPELTDVRLDDVLRGDVRLVLAFRVVYLNAAEHARSGLAGEMERRHWLTETLLPFWRSYAYVAVAALFINMLALASPLFVMNVYDRVLPNKAIASLWVLAIGVAGAVVFDLLLKAARATLIDDAGRRADLKLSDLLFEKVLHATMASRPLSTGEYASRVTQYEFVREFFTSNTVSTLIDCLFVMIFIAVIYLLTGWLAVIPAVAFVVALVIGIAAQHRIGKRVAAASNEASQKQALLVETISTIETVKSLGAEKLLLRKWHELSKNASRTSEDIKQMSAWAANVTGFVQQVVSVLLIVAGVYEFAKGNVSSGAIVATVMLASRAVAPLTQIAMTLTRLRQAMLSLKILNGIMAQPEDRPVSTGFVHREIRSGAVAFQSAEFSYPGTEHKVLNAFSLSIRPGERVGIIGRIGSGKTTIGRLLAGLYYPDSGGLLIDGIDVRQYHPAEVRAAVTFAAQSSDLFSGTVKENLVMGRPGASDAEILDAARRTGVDEFVSRHPRGYDMSVGERGSQLSGGQRQAVAMARLLLSKPKIVFLDEPSGAMDLASERELIRTLSNAFSRDVTLIIATHRYSMLDLVDRLVVIDQGRVVADGPKKAVIESLQQKRSAN